MSFIVYGLPRSRTFWLSKFLTYADWTCGHEEIRHARSLDDVTSWFKQPCVGTVETAAAPYWRLIQAYEPKTVVIRRDVNEVIASLSKLNIAFDPAHMTALMKKADAKLDQIEHRVPNMMSVKYDDLAKEETCKQIFEFCLPYQHDPNWWSAMSAVNLQINLPALLNYFTAYAPQHKKLATIAKHTMVANMQSKFEIDGMEIQEEDFETFYRDGQKLFAEHRLAIGESPDMTEDMDIELMRELDKNECMQIITGRCNGRMFGYLMTLISPSLEEHGRMSAVNTVFYASKDANGLGLMLQRSAIEKLREKGVDELFYRAHVRAPKLASLYKRMGAVSTGELLVLKL